MSNLAINKNVELKASFEWIKQSFFTFRERPLQFMVLGIFSTLIGFLPLVGAFMTPIFMAKFVALANQVKCQQEIKFSSIFDNMFSNLTIMRLAFLNFCLNALFLLIQYIADNQLTTHGLNNSLIGDGILIILFIPVLILQLGMWLAPAICWYNPKILPKSALWLSIKVGLYNIPTLLLYSILIVAFTLLALVPLGLGLLIWLPILNIAAFHIYHEVLLPPIAS